MGWIEREKFLGKLKLSSLRYGSAPKCTGIGAGFIFTRFNNADKRHQKQTCDAFLYKYRIFQRSTANLQFPVSFAPDVTFLKALD